MRTALTSPVAYALFVLPTILLYGLFFLYPMLSSSFYAFTDWNGLDDYRFVGFDNFLRALQDERFHKAILNNLAFIGFSVFVQIPVIVLMAMLISSVKRLQRFYKTAVFVPSILSTSVIGILWGFLYEPEMGPVGASSPDSPANAGNRTFRRGPGGFTAPFWTCCASACPSATIPFRHPPGNWPPFTANCGGRCRRRRTTDGTRGRLRKAANGRKTGSRCGRRWTGWWPPSSAMIAGGRSR